MNKKIEILELIKKMDKKEFLDLFCVLEKHPFLSTVIFQRRLESRFFLTTGVCAILLIFVLRNNYNCYFLKK
jgi:hypothetical protein